MTKRQSVAAKPKREPVIGLDRREFVLLSVIRCYLLAYVEPSKPHWETAMDLCVGSFGHAFGPGVAYSVMEVLRTMREARGTVFRFRNPCCQACAARTSDCERLLLQIIGATQRGDQARARMDALILCEGHDTSRFLAAVSRLAATPALNSLSR